MTLQEIQQAQQQALRQRQALEQQRAEAERARQTQTALRQKYTGISGRQQSRATGTQQEKQFSEQIGKVKAYEQELSQAQKSEQQRLDAIASAQAEEARRQDVIYRLLKGKPQNPGETKYAEQLMAEDPELRKAVERASTYSILKQMPSDAQYSESQIRKLAPLGVKFETISQPTTSEVLQSTTKPSLYEIQQSTLQSKQGETRIPKQNKNIIGIVSGVVSYIRDIPVVSEYNPLSIFSGKQTVGSATATSVEGVNYMSSLIGKSTAEAGKSAIKNILPESVSEFRFARVAEDKSGQKTIIVSNTIEQMLSGGAGLVEYAPKTALYFSPIGGGIMVGEALTSSEKIKNAEKEATKQLKEEYKIETSDKYKLKEGEQFISESEFIKENLEQRKQNIISSEGKNILYTGVFLGVGAGFKTYKGLTKQYYKDIVQKPIQTKIIQTGVKGSERNKFIQYSFIPEVKGVKTNKLKEFGLRIKKEALGLVYGDKTVKILTKENKLLETIKKPQFYIGRPAFGKSVKANEPYWLEQRKLSNVPEGLVEAGKYPEQAAETISMTLLAKPNAFKFTKKVKLSAVSGKGEIINPEDIIKLPKPEKKAFMDKILVSPEGKEYTQANVYTYDLFKQAGKRRTISYLGADLTKVGEAKTFDIFKGKIVEKDITTPNYRAAGKYPKVQTTLIQFKPTPTEEKLLGIQGGGKKSSSEYLQGLYTEQKLETKIIPQPIIKTPRTKTITIKEEKTISENLPYMVGGLGLKNIPYAGTGMYEVTTTTGGLKYYPMLDEKVKTTEIQFENLGQPTKTISESKSRLINIPKIREQSFIGEQPKFREETRTKIREQLAFKFKQSLLEKQKTKQDIRQQPKIQPRERGRIEKIKMPKIIIPLPRLGKQIQRTKQQEIGAEAFGIRFGKEMRLSGGTKEKASKQLKEFLGETLGASGFLTIGGKKIKAEETGLLGGSLVKSKVSPYKIVELRSKRLKTKGLSREVPEIQTFRKKKKKVNMFEF